MELSAQAIMKMFKKHVYDLQDTQQDYFQTGLKNITLANEILARMQTSILTIVLAEMAFLGTLGLHYHQWGNSIAATVLVMGLVLFLIGVNMEHAFALKSARDFIKKSRDMQAYIKEHKETQVSEIPDDLQPEYNSAKTNKLTNRVFLLSYVLLIMGSLVLLFIIWHAVLIKR